MTYFSCSIVVKKFLDKVFWRKMQQIQLRCHEGGHLLKTPTRKSSAAVVAFGVVLICAIWIGLYFKVQSEQQIEISDSNKQTASLTRAFEEHTLRTIKSTDQ